MYNYISSHRNNNLNGLTIAQHLNARLDVISREKSGVAIHYTFPPTVIVFLDHINDGSFIERQFVIFVLLITVYRYHWKIQNIEKNIIILLYFVFRNNTYALKLQYLGYFFRFFFDFFGGGYFFELFLIFFEIFIFTCFF